MNLVYALGSMGFRSLALIKRYEPEIAMIFGGLTAVGAIVSAADAGIKCKEIGEELEKELEYQAKVEETARTLKSDKYSAADGKEDRRKIKRKAHIKMAKVWSKVFFFALASGFSFALAYKVMQARYLGMVAYAAKLQTKNAGLEKALALYAGEEGVAALSRGESLEIPTQTVDENGNIVDGKTVVDPVKADYAYLFGDGTNGNWSRKRRDNVTYLYQAQKWANAYLQLHGHLFLNTILKYLGYEPVKDGQVVGWVYDPKNPNKVDFGVFRTDAGEATARFIDGIEDNVWLIMNVDGPIVDKLGWAKR